MNNIRNHKVYMGMATEEIQEYLKDKLPENTKFLGWPDHDIPTFKAAYDGVNPWFFGPSISEFNADKSLFEYPKGIYEGILILGESKSVGNTSYTLTFPFGIMDQLVENHMNCGPDFDENNPSFLKKHSLMMMNNRDTIGRFAKRGEFIAPGIIKAKFEFVKFNAHMMIKILDDNVRILNETSK